MRIASAKVQYLAWSEPKVLPAVAHSKALRAPAMQFHVEQPAA